MIAPGHHNYVVPINPYLKLSERYSLRNNLVIPLISKMEQQILKEDRIIRNWGGEKRVLTEVFDKTLTGTERKTIGDLFLPDGNIVPQIMKDVGSFSWQVYDPNYSDSIGWQKPREAIKIYYKQEDRLEQLGIDLPLNRIIIGEGVTGLMRPIFKLFADPTQPQTLESPARSFGAGAIGYAPWFGTGIQEGVFPEFYPVDSRHCPQVTAADISPAVQFVQIYPAGNPGAMFIDRGAVENVARAISEANDRDKKARFLLVDDPYRQFIPKEKRVNYFEIAKKYGIPLILVSSFDKPISTGAHGGWMVYWIPPEMEKLGKLIDDNMNIIQGVYLGTNAVTQIQIMIYHLILAGFDEKKLTEWMMGIPKNAPTRNMDDEEFLRKIHEYGSAGLFHEARNMLDGIDRNLSDSWERTNSVLRALEGNERYVKLQGEKPDMPFYLFLQLLPDLKPDQMPWPDVSSYLYSLAFDTGIGGTDGLPFIGQGYETAYGFSWRYAVVGSPMMNSLDNPGEKINFITENINYIKAILAEKGIRLE